MSETLPLLLLLLQLLAFGRLRLRQQPDGGQGRLFGNRMQLGLRYPDLLRSIDPRMTREQITDCAGYKEIDHAFGAEQFNPHHEASDRGIRRSAEYAD